MSANSSPPASDLATARERVQQVVDGLTMFARHRVEYESMASLRHDVRILLDEIARLSSLGDGDDRARPNLECPCGNALRRDGETVKSHWTGSICEDCEADIWHKHPTHRAALAKVRASEASALDHEADLMAAWLRDKADDAHMTEADAADLLAASSLIQRLRARTAPGGANAATR